MSSSQNPEKFPKWIFPWVGSSDDPFDEKTNPDKNNKNEWITVAEIVKNDNVPRPFIVKYLEEELAQAELFTGAPFTALFFVAFAGFVLVHQDASAVRSVEDSIVRVAMDQTVWGKELYKTAADVNSVSDFWSWIRIGFIPTVFGDRSLASEGSSDPELFGTLPVGFIGTYNRIVGGVRIRKQQALSASCKAPVAGMEAFIGRACHEIDYTLEPDVRDASGLQRTANDSWFMVQDTEHYMKEIAARMEVEQWLNVQTQKVELSIPTYNAEFGLHTLTTINFYFPRTGQIWKKAVCQSVFASWWMQEWYIFWDALFGVCLLVIFLQEALKVRAMFIKRGDDERLRWWANYVNFFTVVDWCNIAGGAGIGVLVYFMVDDADRTNDKAALIEAWDTTTQSSNERTEAIIDYVMELDSAVRNVQPLTLLYSVYPFFIMLRLFKGFSAQPRCAMLIDSALGTVVDLMHVLVIFSVILVTFATSGVMLFGRKLSSFTTLPRAVHRVFMSMMGVFEWEELRAEVDNVEAAVWLVLTLLMCNLLVFNVLLAMVYESYVRERRGRSHSETFISEMMHIASRFWGARRKKLVPISAVCKALQEWYRDLQDNSRKNVTRAVIGRDAKAEVGMRVEPLQPEIRKELGHGHIIKVGHVQHVCRVRHADGNEVDYETGHDLNFELQLCEDEKPKPPDPEDDSIRLHCLSPERLIKIMGTKGFRMPHKQAFDILGQTVKHYYNSHSESFELDILRTKLQDVNFKVRKMRQDIRHGHVQSLNKSAPQEVQTMRFFMSEFYQAVDMNRQNMYRKLNQSRDTVNELSDRVLAFPVEQIDWWIAENDGAAELPETATQALVDPSSSVSWGHEDLQARQALTDRRFQARDRLFAAGAFDDEGSDVLDHPPASEFESAGIVENVVADEPTIVGPVNQVTHLPGPTPVAERVTALQSLRTAERRRKEPVPEPSTGSRLFDRHRPKPQTGPIAPRGPQVLPGGTFTNVGRAAAPTHGGAAAARIMPPAPPPDYDPPSSSASSYSSEESASLTESESEMDDYSLIAHIDQMLHRSKVTRQPKPPGRQRAPGS